MVHFIPLSACSISRFRFLFQRRSHIFSLCANPGVIYSVALRRPRKDRRTPIVEVKILFTAFGGVFGAVEERNAVFRLNLLSSAIYFSSSM